MDRLLFINVRSKRSVRTSSKMKLWPHSLVYLIFFGGRRSKRGWSSLLMISLHSFLSLFWIMSCIDTYSAVYPNLTALLQHLLIRLIYSIPHTSIPNKKVDIIGSKLMNRVTVEFTYPQNIQTKASCTIHQIVRPSYTDFHWSLTVLLKFSV